MEINMMSWVKNILRWHLKRLAVLRLSYRNENNQAFQRVRLKTIVAPKKQPKFHTKKTETS